MSMNYQRVISSYRSYKNTKLQAIANILRMFKDRHDTTFSQYKRLLNDYRPLGREFLMSEDKLQEDLMCGNH